MKSYDELKAEAEASLSQPHMVEMIAAVRADKVVGRGSCSCVDECYNDLELAEALIEQGARSPGGAVRAARRIDRLFREREREIDGTVW